MKNIYLSLYFDEDVSVKIAHNLRNRGFDVQTTLEAKNLAATDEHQLVFSVKRHRALVTHNIKDFLNIHKTYLSENKTHNGIILAVRRHDPYLIVSKLLTLLQSETPENMKNQLRYI